MQKKISAKGRRRGVLTLEMALVLPVLLLVLLGTVELAFLLLGSQAIGAAAEVGARQASYPGATRASVERAVREALGPWRFARAVAPVEIRPAVLSQVESGEPVSVRVRVRSTAVAPDLLRFFGISLRGRHLEAASVMRRE